MAVTPSVLLVIEPRALSQPCLPRALMLARYLHARLDIICPESGLAGSPAQARQLLEEERQYAASLLQSIAAPDLAISIETAPGALAPMVASKAREKQPLLVIKAPWTRASGETPDAELLRTCPVPLLLTRGRPWHPRPRLLAALNLRGSGAETGNQAILEAASDLQHACAADLDLVYVDERGPAGIDDAAAGDARARLERLQNRFRLSSARIHLLHGNPVATLRDFAGRNAYDVLIVGAPSRQLPAPSPQRTPIAQGLTGLQFGLLSVQGQGEGIRTAPARRRGLRWQTVSI